MVEAAVGFEPTHRGFAGLLSTELKGNKGHKTTLRAHFSRETT
jgi:hypothetical protein